MTSLKLMTGRYSSHRREDGTAVATSLGQPRWPLRYPLDHEVRDLMPYGLLGSDLDWPEFEQGYRDRLDGIGPDRLRRQLEAIAAEHPGQPLVLLCWEDVHAGHHCHRRLAAAWLEEHGFGPVPEVAPAQMTLDALAATPVDGSPAEPAQNSNHAASGQPAEDR